MYRTELLFWIKEQTIIFGSNKECDELLFGSDEIGDREAMWKE